MARTLAVILALVCATGVWCAGPKADFYIAPNGNDHWSGKLAAPNAARSDGPFATMARAQQAVRALKAARPGRAITVQLAGGMYYLGEPLTFTPADSGTDGAPVTYRAAPGEKPVLDGGVRLTGFKLTPDGRWQLHIPDVATGKWSFCQLFVNGQRRYRPRLPKNSYYFITDGPSGNHRPYNHFTFKPGQIRSDWHNLGDVEVLVFNNWTDSRMRIKSVDDATHEVTFTGNAVFDMARNRRFIVENVREGLSQPGEFYLDNKTGILTYIPMPGEKIDDAFVIAPRLDRLMTLKGDGTLGQWVEDLHFQGLTFAHANWVTPPGGYCCGQGEVALTGAIRAAGARNCVFNGCIVKQCGAWAFDLTDGCADNRIEDCDLVDLGAGGIKIGDQGLSRDPKACAHNNTVINCTIAHLGRLHPAGHGVWVGQSYGNHLEHLDIWDTYYSGFSLGWTWGYGPSQCHDNIVEYNHVHQIGQQVLSDMGCIYTLGIEPGTIIRYNRFHDIDYYYYGAWGIYFDEGSSDILAEDNLVYNTHGGCLHQHYGQNNRLINNIWAFDQSNQLARTRPEDHLSFTFEHNIVYWKAGQLMGGNWNWTGHNYAFDYNLYWNALGEPIRFAGLTLAQWRQKRGQDEHSLIADPMFVDPDHYNFALKPGSPAEKIGFKPFDLSTAGRLTKPHDPLSTETVPRAFPGPPPPQPIEDDFESTPVGQKPVGAQVNEENDVDTIRVTDETAASGKHSLKFTCGPGQKYIFNPHMFYRPHFASGVIEGSYYWRIEPKATPYQEWRQYPGVGYIVGPSLWTSPDGWMTSQGRKLFRIPYGKWMHVDITVALGQAADGLWDLEVSWPGLEKPLEFKNLPCDRRFRVLDWFGMSSNTANLTHFYWDDIRIGPKQ